MGLKIQSSEDDILPLVIDEDNDSPVTAPDTTSGCITELDLSTILDKMDTANDKFGKTSSRKEPMEQVKNYFIEGKSLLTLACKAKLGGDIESGWMEPSHVDEDGKPVWQKPFIDDLRKRLKLRKADYDSRSEALIRKQKAEIAEAAAGKTKLIEENRSTIDQLNLTAGIKSREAKEASEELAKQEHKVRDLKREATANVAIVADLKLQVQDAQDNANAQTKKSMDLNQTILDRNITISRQDGEMTELKHQLSQKALIEDKREELEASEFKSLKMTLNDREVR